MKMNVTIARRYGSGGHDIGKLVADWLGIDFYDKEILAVAAKESGIDVAHFEAADEKPANSFLYSIAMSGQIYANAGDFLTNDKLFAFQSNAILKTAKEKPGLFVGRCADYILRDLPNVVKIFIHADDETRIKRIMEIKNVNEAEAKTLIKKADKKRASYYNFYADGKWGDPSLYDMTINSSKLGIERTAEAICDVIRLMENK
ncbi:MAG: cytidylate kinase-like family protein [Clostridia bacterium]|nr:cytidylate kinase-like family protein [Clostridia bacterium]